MEYEKVCYGGPPLAEVWFVPGFPVAAVLVARFRPRWLPALWIGAWMLALHTSLVAYPQELLYEPFLTVVGTTLSTGLPTGLTAFWLHRSRRYPGFDRAIVQIANVLAVFAGGLWMAAAIMNVMRERLA